MRPQGTLPDQDGVLSLVKAYNLLRYDIGFISEEESHALAKAQVALGSWQQSSTDAPITVLTLGTGDRIGFIRFPSLPQGEDIPNEEMVLSVRRHIQSLQNDVRLIVGLSDWGWIGENEYLIKNPEFVPDLLLGSGRGSGLNGRVLADDRCVWIRPYDKGRSVCEIQIFEWPQRKNSFAWNVSKNYNSTSIGLNDTYKDNPEVAAVLQ
nr:hypothetical protein [uncultured Pseudodesulfovibrio sp.]